MQNNLKEMFNDKNKVKVMFDGKCALEVILLQEGDQKNVICKFISSGLSLLTKKPTTEFCFSFLVPQELYTVENIHLGIVNHVLHNLYDEQAMNSDEEWAFCMLNEELADNMKAWEQGAVYMANKDSLFHRNPIGDSATDFIRCSEAKIKNFLSILIAK